MVLAGRLRFEGSDVLIRNFPALAGQHGSRMEKEHRLQEPC